MSVQTAPFGSDEICHIDRFLNIATRFFQHLSHFAGHIFREFFFLCGQHFACAIQDFSSLRGRNQSPALKSFCRSLNGSLNVGCIAVRKFANHILPVSGVHRGTLDALRYATSLSDDVTAVHVSIDPEEAERVRLKWETWGEGVRLVILDSPYRLFVEPLISYIEEVMAQRQKQETVTIVVPQFVSHRWWHNLLHTQTALFLRLALMFRPGIVITDVPYHVE